MSLWVVVGGQYGSEGKGKIAAAIAIRENVDVAVRCGGPNSGHSFVADDGSVHLVRHLPTAYVNPRTRLLIPAGAVVDLDVLKAEIERLPISPTRVGVDRNAMIIESFDKEAESAAQLGKRLSSTLCGVGSAASRRLMRSDDVRLASQAAETNPWLAAVMTNVSEEVNDVLDRGGRAIIEGTQGFGLSLFHSDHYPKTTSKDTTAAAFLSEVGVSPLRVTDVVLVFRTFPIRVSGAQAGPLEQEITWDALRAESRAPHRLEELTTVTRNVRRVARFDWKLAREAVRVNAPTLIAVNCIDHIDYENCGRRRRAGLTPNAKAFLSDLEETMRTPVGFFGTSPRLSDVSWDRHLRHNETRDWLAS